jgi:hypothetical protein
LDRPLDHEQVGFFRLFCGVDFFTNKYRCDDSDIKTGKPKDPGIARATYSTAQKMRAAMSHKFSRDYELGTQEWQENLLVPGQFYGNPSISTAVSQYMISLRRNKVSAN